MPYVTGDRRKWADKVVDRLLLAFEPEYKDVVYDMLQLFLDELEHPDAYAEFNLSDNADVDVAVGTMIRNKYTCGDLNYVLTRVMWIRFLQKETRYSKVDEAVKILERLCKAHEEFCGTIRCAQFELYRKVGAPYEDGKAIENGEVYTR